MKKNLNIALAVLAASMIFASCATKETAAPVSYAETVVNTTSNVAVSVSGVLVDSKASASSYKFQWNLNEWIRVFNNGKSTFFAAQDEAEVSNFALTASSVALSGQAFAFYPKTVALENGKGTFSLAGQKGLYNEIEKFFLMTSAAQVNNGSVKFFFNEHIAVLAIKVDEFLYANSYIKNITISGEGVSNTLSIQTNGNAVSVKAEGNTELVLNNPVISNGYVFIALLPSDSDINVNIYDNANGHFFTTINGKDLTPGFVNEIDSKWDGGRAITFNPSVSNWNTVNC